MKQILLFAFLLMSGIMFSQSAYTITQSQGQQASTQASSLANPWVGAKLSYNLNEDVPLDESFLLSAKVLYIPVSNERYAVPVVSTIGLQGTDITNPDAGFNVGLYPYYLLTTNPKFNVVVHGGVNYKVLTNINDVQAPQQIKLLGGVEAVFMSQDGGSPTTLSITPAYLFNTNSDLASTGSLEITGVLPIAKGLGLLAESVVPFNNNYSGTFRLGVIVNGKL